MQQPEHSALTHTLPGAINGKTGPDPWRLVRSEHNALTDAQYGSLFTLSNGHLGVRGGLEEAPDASQASFIAGVWESTPIEYHERLPGLARHTNTRLPVADGTQIRLSLDGAPADAQGGQWLDFEQALDLAAGCLRRHLRWRSNSGATLDIEAERIVPWHAQGLLCIRYRVSSVDYHGPVTLDSMLAMDAAAAPQGDDPRFGARIHRGLATTHRQADAAQASVGQKTRFSRIRLACVQRHRLHADHLAFADASTETHNVHQRYTANVHPGDTITLEKYVAYAWTDPAATTTHATLVQQAAAALDAAFEQSFDQHLAAQAAACTRFWNDADLAFADDPASEQALRVNVFHLRQSMASDSRYSPAAKGLTGEGYEGHHFWDSEVFMLPALVSIAPDLARAILTYRIRTLDNARAHAREMDHPRGALYPWRTIGGDECSAYFPAGSAQYHINADIAFALQLYVDASGDDSVLLEGGAEMLFETARLWLEVGYYNPRRQHAFCICQVTGPDEYTVLVDNDFYTNRMAQKHLGYAAQVAAWMDTQHPQACAELRSRIRLGDDEAADWQRAADAMYLPPADPQLNVFPQDDTFLDRPALTRPHGFHATGAPLLLNLHPLTLYRHRVCKQADVLHALVLAGDAVSGACKRRNFDYYEPITTHDSTLSLPVFSIAAAQAEHPEKAWSYFQQTLRLDLDNLHANTAHGVHLASMAGSWMSLAWGLGGWRCVDGTPTFAPVLPTACSGYQFGILWRGRRLRVAVSPATVTYTLVTGAALDIRHHEQWLTLEPGHPASLPLACTTTVQRRFKGVIFDLDGVLADTASVHAAAWKMLANELGIAFDETINQRLKGVDRMTSLNILLEGSTHLYSHAELAALAERKNGFYQQKIASFGPENLLPGARQAIEMTRRAGLKTALASASRNAPALLERLGIENLFDYIVDAGRIQKHKPAPDIFLAAARGLGLAPADCLGVEDAVAGMAAIRAAGMHGIGISSGDELNGADTVLTSIAEFDVTHLAVDTHPQPDIHRQGAGQ